MGRGDKKTAKGKRAVGSYGNSRKRNKAKTIVVKAKTKKAAPKAEAKPVEGKSST